MTDCQICRATTQLFLCQSCTGDLTDMLNGLHKRVVPSLPPRSAPGWIALLEDAATSQTRLGDTVRRAHRTNRLDGDQHPLDLLPEDDRPLVEQLNDPQLEKARKQRHTKLFRQALAAGKVNEHAVNQLEKFTASLNFWVAQLDKHTATPPTAIRDLKPAHAAWWLAYNTHDIAKMPNAGMCFRDIDRHIKTIEHVINRPPPTRFCGPCPNMLQPIDCSCSKTHPHPCQTELRAPVDDTMVSCPHCHSLHNTDQLQNMLWRRLADRLVTYPQLVEICRRTAQPVPVRSTLYKWVTQRRLRVRGYVRAGVRGRIAPTKHSDTDQPVYRLGDVRKLMAEKPRRKVKQNG